MTYQPVIIIFFAGTLLAGCTSSIKAKSTKIRASSEEKQISAEPTPDADNTNIADLVQPTVTISSTANAATHVNPIPVTITFSESVSDFVLGDITLSGGSASNFSGSGTTYTFDFAPSGQGTNFIDLAAGVAHDAAGNANAVATQLSFIYEVAAPTVSISSATSSVTNANPIPVTVTFSEPVTNFIVGDLTLSGGSANNFTGSGTTYTFDFTPSGDGAKTVDIAATVAADEAGNTNTMAPQFSRTYDGTAPTVTITSGANSVTTTSPIPVTITFNESVSAFVVGDISIGNGTAGNFSGSGTTYTADITPTTDGAVTVDVSAGVAADTASNGNIVATQLSRFYDGLAPAPGSSGTITTASVTNLTMTLNWTAATDVVSNQSALQYEVRQSALNNMATIANAEANGAIIQAYTANVTTAPVTGLSPSTTYYFTVIVKDEVGRKALYATKSQATTADLYAPTAGSSGTITTSSVTEIAMDLSWTAGTDEYTTQNSLQYFVCTGASAAAIDTVTECAAATQAMGWTTNTLTTSVSGLAQATTYYYNVMVRDAAGNSEIYAGKSQTTVADTTPPVVGGSGIITATTPFPHQVTLTWTTATDAVTPDGSIAYYICQSTVTANIDTIAECEAATNVLNWSIYLSTRNVAGLTPSTAYAFNLIVRDAVGNKTLYTAVTATTPPDVTAPVAPSFNNTHAITSTSITLTWSAGSDASWPTATLQYYLCSAPTAAEIDTIAECEAGTQSLDWSTATLGKAVTGLTPGTQYNFFLLSRDGSGNKSISAGRTVFTTPQVVTASNDLRSGNVRHSFYDSVNSKHWQFYTDGSNIKTRYSATASAASFTNSTTLAASPTRFNLHFKSVGGVGYIFMVSQENSYDIVLRRGTMAATSITFDSPITVFDGTSASDMYRNPSLTTDDSNVWVAATQLSNNLWVTKARESINAPDGDLSAWQAASSLGDPTMNAREIALVPNGGENVFLFSQAGGTISSFKYATGAWSEVTAGGDFGWFSVGGIAGPNNTVNAIVISGNDIYIGGAFENCGGVATADYIARWDGSAWHGLGPGLSTTVNDIAVSGSDIYAVGSFADAGGNTSADRVAKWDGTTWTSLGNPGSTSQFYAVAVIGKDVYIGGTFLTIAGVPVNYIAKYDGFKWSALGSGVGGIVRTLFVSGTDLYVGGDFLDIDGNTNAAYIAKYDGTNWTALGGGLNGTVNTIGTHAGNVYAGGAFTDAGGNANADYIAKFDGTSWTALGTGVPAIVDELVVDASGVVYVGGSFLDAGGDANADRFTKFDGTNWVAYPSPILSGPASMAISGSTIYVGASVAVPGGGTVRLAKTDGTAWSAIGNGVFAGVQSVAVVGSTLYAGGTFTDAGGNASADYIAKYDSNGWSAVGTGLGGAVEILYSHGTDLYVGGAFTDAGGNTNADRIAKWDGATWTALGTGISSNTVYGIHVDAGGNVYVGGSFTSAGGNTDALRIGKWDGTSWSGLGTGLSSTVYAIYKSGTDVYVGGSFTDAGGNTDADRVAKFDGTSWSALGTGIQSGNVLGIAEFGGKIYARGTFTNVGGNASADYFVKYEGTDWTADGLPAASNIGSPLVVSGGSLYMVANSTLHRFDGTTWTTYTSNLGQASYSLGGMYIQGSQIYTHSPLSIAQYKQAAIGFSGEFSTTTNDLNEPVIAYVDELNNGIKFKKFSGGSWSTATTLTSAVAVAPVLSRVLGSDELIAFWSRAGAFERLVYDGSAWEGSTITAIDLSYRGRQISCEESSAGVLLSCMAAPASTIPYEIMTFNVSW